jgi:hypothetical protein
MEKADYNAMNLLERELLSVLKEEFTFYQSLFVMLDKQRDLIKFNSDEKLLDLFSEIQRCHARIRKSDEKVSAMKAKNPKLFEMAAALPQVKKVINSIATLVNKNIKVVEECEAVMEGKYSRIKKELGELKSSSKIIQYMSDLAPSPQFVDGKN